MGETNAEVLCPCGYAFEVPEGAAEGLVNCPACGRVFKPEDPTLKEETPPASMGQILLDKGWVTPEQLQEALRRQAASLSQGKTQRLGEALVELGILTAQQAQEALALQDTTPMRCPSCGKTYNVRGSREGASATCRACKSTLVPPSGAAGLKVDDTTMVPPRRPAGESFDPSLESLIPGYRLLKRLGYGGMGAVFLARQESLSRLVAVKLLPPEFGKDSSHVRRFLQEARSAARVNHENIVGAVDVGETAGRYFFVMEYVPGHTVFKLIRKQGRIPEKRALDIGRQVARGLRHAHKSGLIHRDVKPKNLMITPEGTVKICDFGLARELAAEDSLAKAGIVIASPAYASPEQCRGSARVDHRTDMYSLGTTLYEMLAGRRPFESRAAQELLNLQISAEPPALRSLNSAISPGAERFVSKLLRKKPEDRFRDYDEMLSEMDALLGPAPAAASRKPLPPKRRPKVPPVWIAAGGLFAAAMLLLVLLLATSGKNPPAGEAPPPADAAEAGFTDPQAGSLYRDALALQESAGRQASRYDAVRTRWKELEERYRGKPDHPRFAAALVEFEARVEGEAEAAAGRVLATAERHLKAGQALEALQALRAFPEGLSRTQSGIRITSQKIEAQKALDDHYRKEIDAALSEVSRERFDDARFRLRNLSLWLQEAERAGHARPDQAAHVENLIRKTDEEELLAAKRQKKDPKPAPPVAPPDPKPPEPGPAPPPPPPPPPASGPAHVLALRGAEERADPIRRASAAAAFGALAPKSMVYRAAALFLSREEKAWGLEGPAGAALAEYLEKVPLAAAEAITPEQHAQFLALLAQKTAACGGERTDALELFACAHAGEIVAKDGKIDPGIARQARLDKGSICGLWGAARTLGRIDLAHALIRPSSLFGTLAAAEAAASAPDFGDRFLGALCAFQNPSLDAARASARWKKLAEGAPGPEWTALCEAVAEQLKQAAVCDSCRGLGRYPCGTCGGAGMATCATCKGTGRMPDTYGGRATCSTCKSRGTTSCGTCNGGKVMKCAGCGGKKTRASVPGSLYLYLAELSGCKACSGGGSAFPTAAWPCPACDGHGRSLEAVRKEFEALPSWMKEREGRALWCALRWLARHQAKEGHWSTSLWTASCPGKGCAPKLILIPADVGITSLALLAFLGAGFTPADGIELGGRPVGQVIIRAAAWIGSRQGPKGLVYAPGSTRPLSEHLLATYALCALEKATEGVVEEGARAKLKDASRRAVQIALAQQQKNAGWADAFRPPSTDTWVTSWGLLALLAARDAGIEVPRQNLLWILQWLDSVTDRGDLHAGYTPAKMGKVSYLGNHPYAHHDTLSASAGLARLLLEGKASGPVIAAEKLLGRDPPSAEPMRRDYCYAFWGTQFLAHRQQRRGNDWSYWVLALERELLKIQDTSDTCALGSWPSNDRWGPFGGTIYATALNALTLETVVGVRPLPASK